MADINPPLSSASHPSGAAYHQVFPEHLQPESVPPSVSAPSGGRTLALISPASAQSHLSKTEDKKQENRHTAPENRLANYQITHKPCLFPWLLSWDFFTPPTTQLWCFPVTRDRPSGSRTVTEELPAPTRHPTLRLRMPEGQPQPAGLASATTPTTPEGAVGGADISAPSAREALFHQAETLIKERHELVDAQRKFDQRTEEGRQSFAEAESQRQQLDQQIDHIIQTYQQQYGQEIRDKIDHWQTAGLMALTREGSATVRELRQIQEEIEPAINEIELFFEKSTHQLCTRLWNQLTDALNRTHSVESYERVKALIDSDRDIRPNEIRPGDDLQLHFLFQALSQEIDSQACIATMAELSDQQREQATENINAATRKVEKIITLFRTIMQRYQRLQSDQQYPHQLAEMEAVVRKGHRITGTADAQPAQDRLALINTLNNPTIDASNLLDMSDEDFQVVFSLLSGQPLTSENRTTMANNSWSLSTNEHLITQRGNERVIVCPVGRRYLLTDATSGAPIGTLNQARWERIHQRLAREGRAGSDNITRRMVIDDYRDYPETFAQYYAERAEDGGNFREILQQENAELLLNPAEAPPPHDQPLTSDVLRYQRRHFQKP